MYCYIYVPHIYAILGQGITAVSGFSRPPGIRRVRRLTPIRLNY